MAKVSVIIPTYNSAAFLLQTVDSILNQTYGDVELFVIDDGSTDNTRQILEPYLGRLTYLYQENQGESTARNEGVRLSHGEYVAFLDSDDYWLPEKLEREVKFLDAHPETVLVYAQNYVINRAGERIRFRGNEIMGDGTPGVQPVFDRLVLDNLIVTPGVVLVRRSALEQTRGFDGSIQYGEDWDLWLSLAVLGPFGYIPEPATCYRIHRPDRRLRIEASDEFVQQNEIILEKAFARRSDAHSHALPALQPLSPLRALRAQAFGGLYLRSALLNYELGDVERGADYMRRAVETDPGLLEKREWLAERGANEGWRIADEKGDLAVGETFIRQVFHSPHGLKSIGSTALAKYFMNGAFAAFSAGDRTKTRQSVWRAVRQDPACLLNRGLVSIGAQSVLGGKPWRK
jgi:glycosyltransferase involved in cell wall biosynthesis